MPPLLVAAVLCVILAVAVPFVFHLLYGAQGQPAVTVGGGLCRHGAVSSEAAPP